MRGSHEEELHESVECTVKITSATCDFGRSPSEHAEDRMSEYYSAVGAGLVRFQLRPIGTNAKTPTGRTGGR
jgi:hypothetical protein